ncbi:MAG: tryptophan--tRNA ligase [Candidatus Shikimatogenerans bostrichidophilus]|nr:MAG: tryptophan--tRNA ligase [Candidatus Shikimatogenerans bostrichidophilus]
MRYMTGIQSTGIPHIGNILGVILPTLSYIKKYKKDKFFIMIADLHSLTNYVNPIILNKNIYKTAAALLSFFFINKSNIYFYRQSDIKEINELFWYLNCFYPFNRLKLSHAIKNKKKISYNTGTINYPILMASDILLYDINKVIIGKDQKQHIEICRKIAKNINNKLKKDIFIIPNIKIKNKYIIPGTDGYKMSKSKKNIINIFDTKEKLEKQIMNIKTINKSIINLSYKEVQNTVLLKLYKLIAKKDEYNYISEKIKAYKIGFYNIKKQLFRYILFKFNKERKKFIYLLNNKQKIKKILYKGYLKSKKIAKKKINKIKKEIGLII